MIDASIQSELQYRNIRCEIENIEFIIIKNQDVNIIVVNIFKIQDFSYKNKSNMQDEYFWYDLEIIDYEVL